MCTKTSKIIIPVRKRFKVIVYNFIYLIQTCKNRMRGIQNHYFCMSLFLTYQPFFIRFCCWGKSCKHCFTWNSLSSIWIILHMDEICTLFPNYYFKITSTPLLTRLSKIFKTFDIRSDLNFLNTQNSRSEHIWTLNFSIRFDSLRTSNISDISNIFDTLARTDFWVELGWIGCAD